MIKARMRNGVSWDDVCILNLSRRGLGIQAAETPARGTYVEICHGTQVIVARVMWAKGHRAGLNSQDAIAVRALVRDDPANDRMTLPPAYPRLDRRRVPRALQQRHESSRLAARALEFACVGLIATAFGLTVFGTVEQALGQPVAQVRDALSR